MTVWSDRTRYQGHTVNQGTKQILDAANKILRSDRYGGEREPVTMLQGSYTGGVGASAGTHDGGGAFDLTPFNGINRVRVFRLLGAPDWIRETWEGPWPRHIHAVVDGDGTVSPSAAAQVSAYHRGKNGLANNQPDRFWRPRAVPILFKLDGDLRPHYCRKTTQYRDEPYSLSQSLGVLEQGETFTPVAWVRNAYRFYWAVDDQGRFVYSGKVRPK